MNSALPVLNAQFVPLLHGFAGMSIKGLLHACHVEELSLKQKTIKYYSVITTKAVLPQP